MANSPLICCIVKNYVTLQIQIYQLYLMRKSSPNVEIMAFFNACVRLHMWRARYMYPNLNTWVYIQRNNTIQTKCRCSTARLYFYDYSNYGYLTGNLKMNSCRMTGIINQFTLLITIFPSKLIHLNWMQ